MIVLRCAAGETVEIDQSVACASRLLRRAVDPDYDSADDEARPTKRTRVETFTIEVSYVSVGSAHGNLLT